MKLYKYSALVLMLFLLVFVTTVRAAGTPKPIKLYVSLNGSDGNNGTLGHPYRSLNRAAMVSQRYSNRGVTIQLRGGNYYLDKTLVLSAENITCASLKIENYPTEIVTISAGRKLQLKWKIYRDGIYKALVPAGISFERLYINGELQQMARYPNYDPKARVYHGTSDDAISPQRIARWKNPAGGYLHALHAAEWGSFDFLIKGRDSIGGLVMEGGWQNNRPNDIDMHYRFVENIMEELDNAGEWYLDKNTRTLYYYPQKGVTLGAAKVEVSNLKSSIQLKGTAARPVKNVTIQGLSFAHNERTFMETKEPLLRSDWTIYRGGAIVFDGTANFKITDCSFTGLGGNAIMVSNYNAKDTISGCYIAKIGASAVCFVGNANAVRSPVFNYDIFVPYEKIDKVAGPLNDNYPRECVVDNNLIHDIGEIEKQATGVEIAISAGITVSHNSIYNTPRAGINIGDGCWGGHMIAYNDVFNTVLETGDHGSFNSWGRDRFWNPNRDYTNQTVKAHPEVILLDALKPTTIRNNRFRCDHGWDIDLDDGSTNYRIYNNLCLNGGLKLREGFYRIVQNNIIINNSLNPHVWFENSGDAFEHNIVTDYYLPVRIEDWGKRIDSNLFFTNAALAQAHSTGTDPHSIAGDALFADAGKGDYTVAPNSPALQIGFKNIDMNAFGVQKPALKQMALQPLISPIKNVAKPADAPAILSFMGGKLKAVSGLTDRSAYGLPDEQGIIILSAGENNLLTRSGLSDRDVIRSADGKPVGDIKSLVNICSSQSDKPVIPIEIIRDQKLVKLNLMLK